MVDLEKQHQYVMNGQFNRLIFPEENDKTDNTYDVEILRSKYPSHYTNTEMVQSEMKKRQGSNEKLVHEMSQVEQCMYIVSALLF